MTDKRNYINKPFMLNLDDPQEKELYEYLRQLRGRVFKQETKAYWMKKMREAKQNEDPDNEQARVQHEGR